MTVKFHPPFYDISGYNFSQKVFHCDPEIIDFIRAEHRRKARRSIFVEILKAFCAEVLSVLVYCFKIPKCS